MLPLNHPLQLTLGLVVWSAWFVAAYGGLSIGCRLAPPDPGQGASTWINLAVFVITVPVVAGLLVLAWRCWRFADATGQGFIPRVAAGLHLSGAVATLAAAGPALYLPPCV